MDKVEMEQLVERAILAGRLVGATNNAGIESGHDERFEAIHTMALNLQSSLQIEIAGALGYLTVEGVEPDDNAPDIAWRLYDGDATEEQLKGLLEGA